MNWTNDPRPTRLPRQRQTLVVQQTHQHRHESDPNVPQFVAPA